MKIYYVRNESGKFVCGPFRIRNFAEEMADNYTGTMWGKCHIEEKEIEDTKGRNENG